MSGAWKTWFICEMQLYVSSLVMRVAYVIPDRVFCLRNYFDVYLGKMFHRDTMHGDAQTQYVKICSVRYASYARECKCII